MVGITFSRPVGPHADTKELEYIAALHQTDKTIRQDGSIRAEDIKHFLSSRHGVRVDEEVVMANIILELGGSLPPKVIVEQEDLEQAINNNNSQTGGTANDNNDEDPAGQEEPQPPVLDLCQIMAMLMIPFFRKGNANEEDAVSLFRSSGKSPKKVPKLTQAETQQKEYRQRVVSHVLDIALSNILAEFKTYAKKEDVLRVENHGMVMTAKVLKQVMEFFGEYNVPPDLIQEMMDQATIDQGGGSNNNDDDAEQPQEVFFNKATFLHALTADTQLYDPDMIDYKESTHYDDARLAKQFQQVAMFGTSKQLLRPKTEVLLPSHRRNKNTTTTTNTNPQQQQDGTNTATEEQDDALPFEVIYTASNLDNTADTYRSTSWFTLVWVETVLIYFSYMIGSTIQIEIGKCQNVDILGDDDLYLPFDDDLLTEYDDAVYRFDDDGIYVAADDGISAVDTMIPPPPGEKPNEFGCAVAKSLVGWLVVFTQMMIMGLSWIWLSTFGNGTSSPAGTLCSKLRVSLRLLIGMGVVSFVCIVSYFVEDDWHIWDTTQQQYSRPANIGAFVGGILILAFQINRLLGLYVPLGPLSSSGIEKKERRIKKAADFKVFSMVEHAMLLHGHPSSSFDSMGRTSVSPSVLDFASSLHTPGPRKSATSKDDIASGTLNKALLNFHRIQEAREEAGGIIWFLRRAWDGTIFEQEGIYLHGRLIAVNILHFFIAALIVSTNGFVISELETIIGQQDLNCTITIGIGKGKHDFLSLGVNWNTTQDGYKNIFNINETHWSPINPDAINEFASNTTYNITDDWYDIWDDIQPFMGNLTADLLALEGNLPKFNGENFLLPGNVKMATLCVDAGEFGLYTLDANGAYPNEAALHNQALEWMDIKAHEWKGALIGGVIAAFAAILSIATTYVPSFVSSVLKFRSGVSPSLKADHGLFAYFRRAPDVTQHLFGTNFWGCFYTALFVFFLTATVIFACLWDLSWPFVKQGIAIALGAGSTIIVKVVIMNILRGSFYSAYYRKRPAASNILNVILECYALATSSLVVFIRLAKLVIVSALYVGRVDTPMLATGVGFNIDKAPDAFTVDLLSHEAHRHPYIERLGLLYLLKLHNGKNFGTRAGAHWRMLFVLALMPWMRNYRLRTDSPLPDEEEDEDDVISIRRKVQKEVGGTRRRDSRDMFGTQLEMDLTRKAYDKLARKNKELRAALIIARDKVRELKEKEKAWKRQQKLHAGKSVSSRTSASSRKSSSNNQS